MKKPLKIERFYDACDELQRQMIEELAVEGIVLDIPSSFNITEMSWHYMQEATIRGDTARAIRLANAYRKITDQEADAAIAFAEKRDVGE